MRLVLKPKEVMFRPEDMGGVDRSWEGHAMSLMYSRRACSAVQEEVVQNVSGGVFWSDCSEGNMNRF